MKFWTETLYSKWEVMYSPTGVLLQCYAIICTHVNGQLLRFLSCRRSRRILFLTRFCFFTQAHAMRLCSVSLKFFNFFLSTTLSNVSTKCLNQFWWNLVTMTNDQAHRCPMTFDPVKGHSRSKGSKVNIFSKTHQVHQVSWYVHNTHTHDSLQCPLQKLSD